MTLGALAVRHGCELRGDPDELVHGVATLAAAGPGTLAFLANQQYRPHLATTRATAVVLASDAVAACPVACLVSANPYLSYALMAADLHPATALRPGIAPGASAAVDCRVPESCQVEPGAVIGAGATLGERVFIGGNAVVGAGCVIGDDSRVMPGAVLYDRVRIGMRCLVHSGAVIGADGFGIARGANGAWTKVPQVGTVVLGNDVEVGANTTIDRGAIEDTVIGDGVKLDNQIQIGHNVVIGRYTAIAGCAGVAGSTRIGERCIIGGDVCISGHISIASDTIISGSARVTRSITKPGVYGGAVPADEARRWRKNIARFAQLDEIARRLRRLEKLIENDPGGDT